jgi:hypothetical protein
MALPADDHLLQIAGPWQRRAAVDDPVEPKIGPLPGQFRDAPRFRLRIGALPVAQEAVMQRVRRNEKANRPQGIHLGAQPSRERYRRPYQQRPRTQPDQRHAGGKLEPRLPGHHRPIGDPDLLAERFEHDITSCLHTCKNTLPCKS